MAIVFFVLLTFTLALTATAAPARSTQPQNPIICPSYTIISTRATGEQQGSSMAFLTMNSFILSHHPGGKVYNTVYPAAYDQQSQSGTQDILNEIRTMLETNPDECFVLQGYSQGATATVSAINKIAMGTKDFEAVKGVFLIGDPVHKAGLSCNVDSQSGSTTRNVNGIEVGYVNLAIPGSWVEKSLDVCKYGDGVCDTTHGWGVNQVHLSYGSDVDAQELGERWIGGVLAA